MVRKPKGNHWDIMEWAPLVTNKTKYEQNYTRKNKWLQ